MVVDEVKKESTYKRPSALSEWYRTNLGRDVAISDIDWVITSISNKNILNRYLILEEKNTSNFDQLLVGLGQSRSLKEVAQDIIKNSVPILVIFIMNEDVSNGVWLYEFSPEHVEEKEIWCRVGNSWYINVKKYARFYQERELIEKLLSTIGGQLR